MDALCAAREETICWTPLYILDFRVGLTTISPPSKKQKRAFICQHSAAAAKPAASSHLGDIWII